MAKYSAKIGIAGNVHADVAAAGQLGIAEMQSAAGDLKAKFIEGCRADNGVMLKDHGEIA